MANRCDNRGDGRAAPLLKGGPGLMYHVPLEFPISWRIRLSQPDQIRIPEKLLPTVKSLLVDLGSELPMTRLSAIIGLQDFASFPEVNRALRGMLDGETDGSCRSAIAAILESLSSSPPDFPHPPVPDHPAPPDEADALIGKYSRIPLQELEGFLREATERIPGRLGEVFRRLLLAENRPPFIKTILRSATEASTSAEFRAMTDWLSRASNSLPFLRVFPTLLELDPPDALQRLPGLLLHESIPVRIMAVRTLYRLFPAEAFRLVTGILQDERESVRVLGISLMMTFPFADSYPILLEALEENRVPEKIFPLVLELVRNNPDRAFLEKVADVFCRRGLEFKEALPLMKATTESMAMVGMEPGTPGSIMGKAIDSAQQRLRTLLKTEITAEAVPAETPSVIPSGKAGQAEKPPSPPESPPTPSETQVSPTDPPDWLENALKTLPHKPDPDFLRKLLSRASGEKAVLGRLLPWVGSLLESSDPLLVVPAMEFLAANFPRTLVPQLQILCFHPDPVVVNQGIRHFRRLDEAGFLQRIQTWVNDGTDLRARKAALTGLAQMKFSRAKPVILRALERIAEPELVEGFGNLLLMNPERDVEEQLRKLAEGKSGQRREYLLALAERCAENERSLRSLAPDGRGRKGALASFLSGDQFESLLQEIRKIPGIVGAPNLGRWFEGSGKRWLGSFLLATIIASLLFAVNRNLSREPSLVLLQDTQPGPFRDQGSDRTPSPSPPPGAPSHQSVSNAPVEGQLVLFDPKDEIWVFKTASGRNLQVKFSPDTIVQAKDRLVLSLLDTGRRTRGEPIYAVLETRRR